MNNLTNLNSTGGSDSYSSTLEVLLKKKSVKYDLYFYDDIYSNRFDPYLEDLNKYIEKEHVDKFDKNIINEISYYKDKLVGIVNIIVFL